MLGRIILVSVIYFLISSIVKSIVRHRRGQRLKTDHSAKTRKENRFNKEGAEDADFEVLDD